MLGCPQVGRCRDCPCCQALLQLLLLHPVIACWGAPYCCFSIGAAAICRRRLLLDGQQRLVQAMQLPRSVPGSCRAAADAQRRPASPTATAVLLLRLAWYRRRWLQRLARRFDCPVVGVRVIRLPGRRFQIAAEGPFELPRDAAGLVDVPAATQMITDVIERWVRENPGQYLWFHRRWR